MESWRRILQRLGGERLEPRAAAEAAMQGDGDLDESLFIRMVIQGGVASERYLLDLSAHGNGVVEARLVDELKAQEGQGERQLAPDRLQDWYRAFLAAGTLKEVGQPRFPPDTVVGRLEIQYGGQIVARQYFAADPDQVPAEVAPPQELQQAVEGTYRLASEVLDVEVEPLGSRRLSAG